MRRRLSRERRLPTHLKINVVEEGKTDDLAPLYFVGDSHVVPFGHRRLLGDRRALSLVVTGLKAWHVGKEDVFFTGESFKRAIHLITSRGATDVVISAGEIDCREGILTSVTKEKYPDLPTAVAKTLRSAHIDVG